jgi:hypothetical protein
MKLDAIAMREQLDSQRRKVDVDHFDVTIREIVRMAESQELIRSPEYQRKFRWSLYDESRLVESLFLGLPIPSIFVATNADGTWELVDGLQRVSTLMHYVGSKDVLGMINKNSSLRLHELEKLSSFNGFLFEELPKSFQLAFWKRFIRVTALSDKSDKEVRFDMFERLNNGGTILTPQEVRACVYRGKFSDFIRELSSSELFLAKLKLQKKRQNDGTKEELVLKFFAYLYDRDDFDGGVKKFLNNYMAKASREFNYEANRPLFYSVVETIDQFTDGPFLRQGVHVTPLNQFEGVMVGIADLLLRDKEIIPPPENWLNDPELKEHSTGGTNTPKKLRGRIRRAKELFSGQ